MLTYFPLPMPMPYVTQASVFSNLVKLKSLFVQRNPLACDAQLVGTHVALDAATDTSTDPDTNTTAATRAPSNTTLGNATTTVAPKTMAVKGTVVTHWTLNLASPAGWSAACTCPSDEEQNAAGLKAMFFKAPTEQDSMAACRFKKFRFVLQTPKTRTRSTAEFTDYDDPATEYLVGKPYRIAPPAMDANATIVSLGHVSDVRYRLLDAQDGFFVNSDNGEIFGVFKQNGTFTMSLAAVDRAGELATADVYTFNVQQPPVFKVATVPASRVVSGDFVDYDSGRKYYASEKHPYVYRIAPLRLDRANTVVSDGTVGDISYILEDAPNNFYVSSKRGEVFGRFPATGDYTMRLVAVDKGGMKSHVQTYSFAVSSPPKFRVKPSLAWDPFAQALSVGVRTEYTVGETYRTAQIPLPASDLLENFYEGRAGETTYKLHIANETARRWPAGWSQQKAPAASASSGVFLVDGSTGLVLAIPASTGNFSAALLAVDGGGDTAVVLAWSFRVSTKKPFGTVATWDGARGLTVRDGYQKIFSLGQTVTLQGPRLNRSQLFENYYGAESLEEDNSASKITYSMSFQDRQNRTASPGNFYVDQSGSTLGHPTIPGEYTGRLLAIDAKGSTAVVKIWPFEVLPRDTAVSSYGPNGKGCRTGNATDAVPFDKTFTCDCSGTVYDGDNCQIAPEASGGSTTDGSELVSALVGGILGSVIIVLVASLAFAKYHAHKLKNMPHDFAADLRTLQEAGEIESRNLPKEIGRKHVHLVECIGSGQFGQVWKAKLDEAHVRIPGGLTVAAKLLTSEAEDDGGQVDELYREAVVTAQLSGHEHVVGLLGVVTAGSPAMLLVSYCEHSSLLSQLKKRAGRQDAFSIQAKHQYALQISKGMAHLAKYRFVHRDLAARNVLIDVEWKAKVADFGLSRETKAVGDGNSAYYRSTHGLMPGQLHRQSCLPTVPHGCSGLRCASPCFAYPGVHENVLFVCVCEELTLWSLGLVGLCFVLLSL